MFINVYKVWSSLLFLLPLLCEKEIKTASDTSAGLTVKGQWAGIIKLTEGLVSPV